MSGSSAASSDNSISTLQTFNRSFRRYWSDERTDKKAHRQADIKIPPLPGVLLVTASNQETGSSYIGADDSWAMCPRNVQEELNI